MKFADLLSFQKPPQNLEDLHAKAVSLAVLNPRSRTEFLEECEAEAKELIESQALEATDSLQQTFEADQLQVVLQKDQICTSVFEAHLDSENILQTQRIQGFERRNLDQNNALQTLINASKIPGVLAPLQDINRHDPLSAVFLNRPQTALPFKFRILSRANELYGANNWETKLANTPENFYDLLIGSVDDTYHSDFEPFQNHFLQGDTGSFVCNKMLAAQYSNTGAISTLHPCIKISLINPCLQGAFFLIVENKPFIFLIKLFYINLIY